MVDVVGAVLPAPGSRAHAELSVRAGGSAVNAAAAAAAAGASAAVVGRIGRGAAGDLVLAELAKLGVEAMLARDPELATGAAVALGEDAGKPGIVAHRGANARLSPEDVPDPLEADALFVSGFALFQDGSSDGARAALDRFAGAWIGVDVGSPRLAARVEQAELEAFGERIVLLATTAEAQALTGEEPKAAARALASRYAVACVKQGAEGAVAASKGQLVRASVEEVARTSPFGAGDAFGAVLLVALTGGASLGTALERACAAGALEASR
jgi:sugar/nucleoside kinase (ribokinase family)